jgi:FtsP/CotA-like multicopper oxidase with cupredoxin domain
VPLFRKQDREVTGVAAFFFGVIAVIVAFAAVAVAKDAKDNSSGAATNGSPVTLTEFAITPTMISVPENGKLVVTNNGTMEHNFTINADYATKNLKPGESETLDLKGLKAGTYDAQCSIPGHAAAGMTAMVHVGQSGGAAAATNAKPNADEVKAMNAIMAKPTLAYVAQLKKGANTKGVGNQLMKPKVLADGTKEFDLKAEVVPWEVSPGKTVQAWTYNGMVPGPWIKVNPGDKVKMVLDNELPEPTVIHWHGITVPNAMDGVPDVTQPPVDPGKKFTYSFTTSTTPELGMYHSHDFAQHQVPDGMLGIFQIGDPPLPANTGPITQQVPMVLNDAGVIGLSLNGKSFPATAPIIAKPDEWVEINYFNEGLQMHPMHLHGIPQLVIGKDGFPLPNPYKVDTLVVAPGERYTVLVHPSAANLGVWAYHCHILTHAETNQGMFGMVTTFIVKQ